MISKLRAKRKGQRAKSKGQEQSIRLQQRKLEFANAIGVIGGVVPARFLPITDC